jgi:hypothetical protein
VLLITIQVENKNKVSTKYRFIELIMFYNRYIDRREHEQGRARTNQMASKSNNQYTQPRPARARASEHEPGLVNANKKLAGTRAGVNEGG